MENKYACLELNRIDCPVGIAPPILYDLQHAGGAESVQRLGLCVLASGLSEIQRVAENVNYIIGQCLEIFLRTADPLERLQFYLAGALYQNWDTTNPPQCGLLQFSGNSTRRKLIRRST